ncbi:MAG: vitamin K epoxide reductase family protein [Ignavibacteriales bacterium]|nr:vitamin K epoxide reductase family protein [Ignavibacteriales bacterium]
MEILVFLFSFCGLIISLYFTLVYNGLIKPDARWIPRACRMEKGTCDTILHTREAKILGIPNFYLGLLYYAVLLWVSLDPEAFDMLSSQIRFASGGTVLLGIILTYSLLYKLKVNCVLCFASHILNFILFLLLLTMS